MKTEYVGTEGDKLSDITLLPASTDDWSEFRDLRYEMMSNDPSALPAWVNEEYGWGEDVWKNMIRRDTVLLAYDNEKPVGMGRMDITDDTAGIHMMYVAPTHRGRDLGEKILTRLLKRATSKAEIKNVELGVMSAQLPAISFYKKFGFKEIRKESDGRTDHGMIIMRKTL